LTPSFIYPPMSRDTHIFPFHQSQETPSFSLVIMGPTKRSPSFPTPLLWFPTQDSFFAHSQSHSGGILFPHRSRYLSSFPLPHFPAPGHAFSIPPPPGMTGLHHFLRFSSFKLQEQLTPSYFIRAPDWCCLRFYNSWGTFHHDAPVRTFVHTETSCLFLHP